jgi:hypothetical protein
VLVKCEQLVLVKCEQLVLVKCERVVLVSNVTFVKKMKFPTALLLLANVAVSLPFSSDLPPSFNDLQGSPMNDADSNFQGMDHVMNTLKANLTSAVDQTMIKLDSILLLNGHKQVSHGLRLKINQFKEDLCVHLRNDLYQEVYKYNSIHGSNPLLGDLEFSSSISKKWQDTLAVQVEYFQDSILPHWVHSVLGVWKGVENKVLRNIQNFKSAISKRLCSSPQTCSVPRSLKVGFSQLESALIKANPNSLDRVNYMKSPLVIIGQLAIIALAISGLIALSVAYPFFFTLLIFVFV